MNNNAPNTNKQHVSDTKHELQRKKITSPELIDMPLCIYDKTSRTWYYFKKKNYDRYKVMVKKLKKLYPDHIFQLSHE